MKNEMTERQIRFALKMGWEARRSRLIQSLRQDLIVAESVSGGYHECFRFSSVVRATMPGNGVSYEKHVSELEALKSIAKREVVRLRDRIDWVESFKNPFEGEPS